MARFGVNDAENYGGNGSSSFFSLKNDKDIARVRFMYNGMEDIEGLAVHEVTVDDKKRYVNCLRSYDEPRNKCPFCEANNMQKAKFYIPLYNCDTDEVQIWERGRNFAQKLSSICARYSSADTPLVSHIFEIERNGKPRDTSTTYEIYEVSCDDTRLEDLPEAPQVLGTIVLDKSADEMRDFLDTGEFPNNGGGNREQRRGDDDRPSGRRTPSNRRGDRF